MTHVDAGKTTLTERILFDTGRIHRLGNVDHGNTQMDTHPLEKKHGITISAAATTCRWNDASITIIDTPGHVDFTVEVERSLRVLDGAVAVFSAVSGVEPQSETVWRQAVRLGVPRIAFVNKMDLVGADFARVVAMIGERLDARPAVVQLPLGEGATFSGVFDLVTMQTLVWDGDGLAPSVHPIPETAREQVQAGRARLLDALADADDEFLAAYLAQGEQVSTDIVRAALRRACLSDRLTPVLCGSAQRNIGVQPLLDAIVAYGPSPADRPPVEGVNPDTGATERRGASVDEPFVALVSKVRPSRFGALAFVRIYAGRVRSGMTVLDAANGRRERIGRLLRMHADAQEEVDEAKAGDVVAVAGLRSAVAGRTLSDPSHPLVLKGFEVPEPLIQAAIEPEVSTDRERLSEALAAMARSDPSLRVGADPETGRTLIAGVGELHLRICVETLKEDFGIEARIGAPDVAWRAELTRRAEVDHLLRKQSGGPGQMARVHLVFEPLADGATGLVFVDRIEGGAIPKEFVPAIEKALTAALDDGGPGGVPLLGLKATLMGGDFHAKDSSSLAFEIATREAFRIGVARAEPVVLEPLMRVVVTTPEEHIGAVIGDIRRRRGQVLASEPDGTRHDIVAEIPLAVLFNYVGALRSLTQGRASFTMAFARYAPAP